VAVVEPPGGTVRLATVAVYRLVDGDATNVARIVIGMSVSLLPIVQFTTRAKSLVHCVVPDTIGRHGKAGLANPSTTATTIPAVSPARPERLRANPNTRFTTGPPPLRLRRSYGNRQFGSRWRNGAPTPP
jgi:hypothetical protein